MRWTALALSILVLSGGRQANEAPSGPAAGPSGWAAWNPFSIDAVPWSRRAALVRPGDSRRQIEALLGPAPVEWPIDGPANGASRVLVYPNPDAPRELKPEQRRILLYLDPAGVLIFSYDLSMTC